MQCVLRFEIVNKHIRAALLRERGAFYFRFDIPICYGRFYRDSSRMGLMGPKEPINFKKEVQILFHCIIDKKFKSYCENVSNSFHGLLQVHEL